MAPPEREHGPPQLTLADAEATVEELELALDKHRDWIKKFQRMVVCRTKPHDKDLSEDSHKRSAFGRWCAKTDNPYIRDHADFASIGEKHQAMHGHAHKLAKRVRDGEDISPKTYMGFVQSVDDFKLGVRAVLTEAREILRYMDALTGMPNRTAMMMRLEEERARVVRHATPCAIAMMDLDRFKSVNDTWGHHMGDRVLKNASRFVLDGLRRYDQVFRYGGEEFLIVLPATPMDQALAVLNRVREGLADMAIRLDQGTDINVTASFGAALLEADEGVKACIDRADQALYRAKDTGRNKVCAWEGE